MLGFVTRLEYEIRITVHILLLVFWSKIKNFFAIIEILVKKRIFCQKSKVWPKIEILVKNPNFGQKSKVWKKSTF